MRIFFIKRAFNVGLFQKLTLAYCMREKDEHSASDYTAAGAKLKSHATAFQASFFTCLMLNSST